MRVAAYTGGVRVPSARARVRQYVAPLHQLGIGVDEYPLPWGNVLPRRRSVQPLWMGGTTAARLLTLARSWSADVTWVSRQLLPAFAPAQALARRPMVLDVDDAVWLNTGGSRAKDLAKACAMVVAGNAYLADYFSAWNANVQVIPTAIDTAIFSPAKSLQDEGDVVLGWTGTSGNFQFLYDIEPALARVLAERPRARLRIVADRAPTFTGLRTNQIEFILWQSRTEAESLRAMSIGLMPLAEDAWCAGKCSYKMLCYMACGLPVVVSPVGMNREVLARGAVGFGAASLTEWSDALLLLIDNHDLRRRMGAAGRFVVEQHYSLHRLAPRYAEILRSVVSSRSGRAVARVA